MYTVYKGEFLAEKVLFASCYIKGKVFEHLPGVESPKHRSLNVVSPVSLWMEKTEAGSPISCTTRLPAGQLGGVGPAPGPGREGSLNVWMFRQQL